MNLSLLQKNRMHVFGDAMLDRYVTGKVNRISPEAPIPVVNASENKDVLGGAANVVRNVCDFGVMSSLVSIIGQESDETSILCSILNEAGVEVQGLIRDESRPTTSKTRVIGNGQQIVRIDKEVSTAIAEDVEDLVIEQLDSVDSPAIIVADYAKGIVTPRVIDALRVLCKKGVMVAVDPHPKNRQDWSGMTVFKPNLSELENITGVTVELEKGEDPRENQSLRKAMDVLYEEYGNQHLLITLSEHGMVYTHENKEVYWEPTRAREVFDVSGAGDTVISYFTMALAAGWAGEEATKLANAAAGLVVQKLGTASLSFDEISKEWQRMTN